MENSFEALITTYINNKVGISENFLSDELANNLKQNLLGLNQQDLLITAGTGNSEVIAYDSAVRSDSIYWLDKKNNNAFENHFFEQIEAFISYLNESCYTGITGYEFHYSLYEKGDWKPTDGGELLIHQENNNQKITPTLGKTVFFKSDELLHEVLVTQNTRMSITGWLKCD